MFFNPVLSFLFRIDVVPIKKESLDQLFTLINVTLLSTKLESFKKLARLYKNKMIIYNFLEKISISRFIFHGSEYSSFEESFKFRESSSSKEKKEIFSSRIVTFSSSMNERKRTFDNIFENE